MRKIVEYKCHDCGHVFEEWVKGAFPKNHECPECGGQGKRIYSFGGFICHQGRCGNYKNGYTSSPVKIKKS